MAFSDLMFNLDTSTYLVGVCVVILVYLVFFSKDNKYKLPPGPRKLPIIGTPNGPKIFTLENAVKIRRQFGEVMLLYMGPTRFVVLSSNEAIKEALVTHSNATSDRGGHLSFITRVTNPNRKGIIHNDFNDELKQNRNSALSIFRHLGVGRATIEERILEESETLIGLIRDQNGESFDPKHMLTCSVTNVILSVVLSKRFEHTDPEFLHLVQLNDDVISSLKHMMLINIIPFLRYIQPFKESFRKILATDRKMIDFMWKYVKEHMDNYNEGMNSDFVFSWLEEHYDQKTQKPNFDEENFKYVLRDLLLSGTETTTTSLKWALIQLANNPEIQKKLQLEIDSAIGKKRSIRLGDREKLPRLEAFLLEVIRFNTVTPFSLPHYTNADIKVCSYDIPAHSFIVLNLHGLHMNEETFQEPQKFNPERFLDSDGKFVKHPQMVAFGVGKRSCLGELLARQELFIIMAAMVQKFDFSPPEGLDKINDETVLSFTASPKPFMIRAACR